MKLSDALNIYYKSDFGDEKVYQYASSKDGIVLLRKPKGIEFSTCHFLITSSGEVKPTNPLLTELGEIKDII